MALSSEPFETLRSKLRGEVAKGTVAGAAHQVLCRGRELATVAEGKANGKERSRRFGSFFMHFSWVLTGVGRFPSGFRTVLNGS